MNAVNRPFDRLKNTFSKRTLFLRLICCTITSLPYFLNAAIIYVNPSAGGANNGTNWENAFTSLSTALLSATNGDEVWVKKGVYKPVTKVDFNNSGGTDPREATFKVPFGVALYGGFTGNEVTREQRSVSSNLTILSGDIDNNDINMDANSIAENTSDIMGSNAYHVLYTLNVNAATRVDGFVITAGKALSSDTITDPNQDGGAWYNKVSGVSSTSSPTILNCLFQGNYAESEGGALYNTPGSGIPTMISMIEKCKFIGNKSNYAAGAIYLGSFKLGNYQLHIKNCEFSGNEAYESGGAMELIGDHSSIDSSIFRNNKVTVVSQGFNNLTGSGGGVRLLSSSAAFRNCIFEGNSSTGVATGPFESGGGGAVNISHNEYQTNSLGLAEPKFINCGFYGNTASGNTAAWGGAIVHVCDGGKLRPKYVNCVFSGNQAQNDGGAIANYTRVLAANQGYVPDFTLSITNCTFVKNNASKEGGAIYTQGYIYKGQEVSNVRIENSIIWNNSAGKSSPEVFFTGKNVVAYSVIRGSGGSGGGWKTGFGTDGSNNLDVNPSFLNENDPDGADNVPATADDGLRLKITSSPVNKGNNAAIGLTGITTDYASAARILGGKVDMGAYERSALFNPGLSITWLANWNPNTVCLSCSWAFVFKDRIFKAFVWDEPAQLIEREGNAIVTGHIVNPDNRKAGFKVYLTLKNKQDWESWNANGGTYTAVSREASLSAIRNHNNWSFWELSDKSYLTGTGALAGQINLTSLSGNSTGFQSGEGANGWDKDPGISGSFAYKGTITYEGARTTLNGVGSMNVDATPCSDVCTPLSDKVLTATDYVKNELSASSTTENPDLSLFPMPAHSQFTISRQALTSGIYTLKFYNTMGQLKKQENRTIANGNATISVKDLNPGHYILQLVSASGKTWSKKLILE